MVKLVAFQSFIRLKCLHFLLANNNVVKLFCGKQGSKDNGIDWTAGDANSYQAGSGVSRLGSAHL